jgi:nitrogen regulatory protein P-II 1
MKKIEAIIRTTKLESVKDALCASGAQGMTITESIGVGMQSGHTITYRGAEVMSDYVQRVKLETVVADEAADDAIDVIFQNAYTGDIGDGRIFVTDVERVIRIRTGEVEVTLCHPSY